MVSLRLENNGLVVDITNTVPKGILKLIGSRGFGVAPTNLSIREGAAEGGRHRRTKRGIRQLDIPFAFNGETPLEVYGYMRNLVNVLNDRDTPCRMFVSHAGEDVFTEVHLAAGADHQYGTDTNGRTWARWPVTLKAPNPYWTAVNAINYSLSTANAGRGLIKSTSLSKLRLTSSSAIGSVVVNNPGDVPAYALWTVRGPGNGFTAKIAGSGFAFTVPILNSIPITIDTENKTVTDATGANRYGDLGPAPKLFPIPAGRSVIDIVMEGSNSTSLIQFNFQPRYEIVF